MERGRETKNVEKFQECADRVSGKKKPVDEYKQVIFVRKLEEINLE